MTVACINEGLGVERSSANAARDERLVSSSRDHVQVSARVAHDDADPLVGIGKGALGAAVKAGRLRNRWPQRWLAFQAGVSQTTISRLENGRLTGIRGRRSHASWA